MRIFVLILTFLICSCAAPHKDLDPKSYIYNAERANKVNMSALRKALVAEGYQIRSFDELNGSLTTEQRVFNVSQSDKGIEQLLVTVNVHQERSNLKLTVAFLCKSAEKRSICSSLDLGLIKQVQDIQKNIDILAEKTIQ